MKKFSEYLNSSEVVNESYDNQLEQIKKIIDLIETYTGKSKYNAFVNKLWNILFVGFGDSLKVSKMFLIALRTLRDIDPENKIVKSYGKELD